MITELLSDIGLANHRYRKLLEGPLPDGISPSELEQSRKGRYTSKQSIEKFEELGIKVGKGSSRIAFLVKVDSSRFPPSIIEKYDLPKSGMVDTVFKLAINAEGIAQNDREIKNFIAADNRYLMPILDTSIRNKGYRMDDVRLSNWLQMPYAQKVTIGMLRNFWKSEFGIKFEDFIDAGHKFRGKPDMLHHWMIDQHEGEPSEEIYENIDELASLFSWTTLRVGDMVPRNFGLWNGRLYFIDYGFDDETFKLYQNTETASAYVDASGEIQLMVRPT